jgi:transposase InsO family protein
MCGRVWRGPRSVHDILADGRRFRVLVVVDDYSRECLALEVDTSITGQRVSRVLDRLRDESRLPQVLVCERVACPRGTAAPSSRPGRC